MLQNRLCPLWLLMLAIISLPLLSVKAESTSVKNETAPHHITHRLNIDDDSKEDDDDDDHIHHDNSTFITTTMAGPLAEASKWADHHEKIKEVSLCYGTLNYFILDKKKGRLEVNEGETAQFSLSINKTRLAALKNSTSEDCSVVWLRIEIEMLNNIETSAIVDSHKDATASSVSSSRIVAVKQGTRFPLRNYVRGLFLGYANINFQALPKDFNLTESNATDLPASSWVTIRSGKVATFRSHRPIDTIFQIVIFCLIIFGNCGIGLDVHWKDIRKVVRRPIGPIIGFCCQYIVMPLSGFTVVKLIELPPNIALGVFLIGCAPGGGGSNFHTYFMGGDLALSVTMTFFSTICATFMMPLWVFTLGKLVINEAQSGITIDFRGILISLASSLIPFLIGIFIHWKKPELAKRIFNNVVRPLLLLIFIYMLTAGLYTNLYLFRLMEPRVLLAGVCLPYVGFSLGFVIAMLARQGFSIAITVAIETGIQSVGVAITTLMLSLPQPDADIAIVGPLAVAMFTPVPLWIMEIIRGFFLCYKGECRKKLQGAKHSIVDEADDDFEEQETAEDEESKRIPTHHEEEAVAISNPWAQHVTPKHTESLHQPLLEVTRQPSAVISEASTLTPAAENAPQSQRSSTSSSSSSSSSSTTSASKTSARGYDNVQPAEDVHKTRESVYHDALQ